MGTSLFVTFHILSFAFCLLATRLTCRYLSKRQITPKTRHFLFGLLPIRYLALFYVLSIGVLSLYSVVDVLVAL